MCCNRSIQRQISYKNFNDKDEYFLGSLVVFKNADDFLEVIDGQQRLITLTLLLRAFYEAYGENMKDSDSHDRKRDIEKCLWKTPEPGEKLNMSELKIFSLVATENESQEFTNIMLTGKADPASKSRYASNYRLFQGAIKNFLDSFPNYLQFMTHRILANCSVLPIEAINQSTALRIFSTLNDRGKPLSDSDIFKAKLYKAFSNNGQKDLFIAKWRDFENICSKSTTVDDIFMRYMYCVRAFAGIRDSGLESLRDFYSRDDNKFSLLNRDYAKTFDDLITLADFWKDITVQETKRFSDRVLKQLFILHHMPTNMWTFLVSVYFMANKGDNGILNEKDFCDFLRKITAFILASRLVRPGNNAPFFNEMASIASGHANNFSGYEFDIKQVRERLSHFDFLNSSKLTKSFVVWQVFQDKQQILLSLESKFDIEHILPRRRENELSNKSNLESIGNKSLLEREINIRASDYRFRDKANYYLGNTGKKRTNIHELIELADGLENFTEQDIITRTQKIFDGFVKFIQANNLAK
ncbi:MAG: DUF262 domain-containing protein [Synergistaceae bacterium]|nr:DUF262 domain-containing protein [Synergistaceae bacterium]